MPFEFEFLDFLQTMHTPLITKIMKAASKLGDAGFVWILLTGVLLMIPKTRKVGILVSVALLLDVLTCNVILKPLIARTRPYDVNTAVELLIRRCGIIRSHQDIRRHLLQLRQRFGLRTRRNLQSRRLFWRC